MFTIVTLIMFVLFVLCLHRFYQMDKTCLQDHVGKIRAALCDKGIHRPHPHLLLFALLVLRAFLTNSFAHIRPMCDVRDAASVPSDDLGRRERVQGPGALLREHPQAGDRPPPAAGLRLPPHPLALDSGTHACSTLDIVLVLLSVLFVLLFSL